MIFGPIFGLIFGPIWGLFGGQEGLTNPVLESGSAVTIFNGRVGWCC